MKNNFYVGIYIRLSREDEAKEESSSVKSQRDFLKNYIKEKGYELKKEYIDDGYTGTNFERPSFQKMLKDIENNIINMVIVKDLSRLGRNNSKVSYYLDEYFPIHKIRFIAVNNDYDSYIENASLEYAWLTNGINENYCLDISKKVRTALKTRKQKGYFTGFKAPYGYQRSKEDYHKIEIDKEASKIVKRIFFLASKGFSPTKIASILSNEKIPNPSTYANLNKKNTITSRLWCTKTIKEMLTNETYIGNLTQGRRKKINYKIKKQIRLPKEEWIIIQNTHEPIIEKEVFYIVQNIINKNQKGQKQNDYLLKGLLYCKECKHRLSVIKSRDKKRLYLSCSYYRKYSKQKLCTPHTMNYEKLEKYLLEKITSICEQQISNEEIKKLLEKQKKRKRKKTKEIELEKDKIRKVEEALKYSYIDKAKGNITKKEYEEIKKTLLLEKSTYEEKIKEWEKPKSNQNKNKVETFLKKDILNRIFLTNLIDKIYITEDKKIEIYFKIKSL